jgi:hypothetical protein
MSGSHVTGKKLVTLNSRGCSISKYKPANQANNSMIKKTALKQQYWTLLRAINTLKFIQAISHVNAEESIKVSETLSVSVITVVMNTDEDNRPR